MEDPNVSLPKQEVYEEYKSFCNANNLEPLCAADFGKVMKQVFPSVKPRRLGTRGNSRYCYSGLSKNLVVKSHTLPNLCSNKETCDIKYKDSSDDDVHNAACQLVLEWAEKLLEEKFTAIKDLAWYLVDNLCVDSRSVAAFTLLFFNNVDHQKKGNQAANLLKQVCGNRKRETQIHLQRKLQEKELIKEQKKKVQEQRQITKSVVHKTSSRKSQRSIGKKTAASGQQNITDKQICNNSELCDNSILEEKDFSLEVDQKVNFNNNEKTDDKEGKLHSLSTSTKFSTQHLDIASNIEQTCDDNEIKQKLDKVPIPRKGGARTSTVCITPGIIAVPPVQITLLGPQTSPKPQKFEKKYKRIQPKSTTNKLVNRNSTLFPLQTKRSNRRQLTETNNQRDNKLSNLWNQSDDVNSEKSSEESNGTKIISSPTNNSTLSVVNDKATFEVESVLPVTYTELDNNAINLNGHLNFDNSNELNVNEQIKNVDLHSKENTGNTSFTLNKICDNFVASDVSNINEMMSSMKRHCEEYDSEAVASKKPLLENILTVKNAIAYLPTWENKEGDAKIDDGNKLLPESLIQAVCSSANDEKNCNQEEVSIHQLETDALIEYYDISSESNQLLFEKTDLCNKDIPQQVLQNTNGQKQQACNTAAQLSQLRMLLERNLPKPLSKCNTIRNFKKTEQLETPEQSSVSSFLSLNNESFDVNHQNEKTQEDFNQIIIKDADNMNELSGNYEDKLTTVCWSDTNDQNITIQKESILPQTETHQSESLSEKQIISHIQNSLLSGENSNDVNIIGSNIAQPAMIINTNDVNSLNNTVCISESGVQQLQSVCNSKQTSTHTQIPSVPPSPNARRLAFNFLPISPRQTPILENNSAGSRALASPVPSTSQFITTNIVHNNMVSVAVGSSRPTSAASSPFVSPRSTPVPLSRSRHNSGQSAYSTPRQTPLQNFDSGVSSISTSPFISPQPTPLPISRLRHNSSHSQGRTVTFNAVGSPHAYSQTLFSGSRSRHNSGPGIPHQLGSTMSPRSAPLSPMVNDCYSQNQFSFPCVGDTPTLRSRHNSASSAAPLSPVSEQVSPPANNAETSINNDKFLTSDSSSQYSSNINKNQETDSQAETCTDDKNNGEVPYQQLKSLLNSKILFSQNNTNSKQQHQPNITVQSELKQWINNRQRHTSGPLLFQETSRITDQSSQEIQLLLRNSTCTTPSSSSNRSQSVPPYQMLQNLINQYSPITNMDNTISKSHPTTPIIRNSFTFPPNKLNNSALSVVDSAGFVPSSLSPEEIFSPQVTDQDEVIVNGNQSWDNLNREISSARRNISDILEQQQEDLDMALDDLRDFDADFSLQDFKLAQELEEMNPSESDLS
ncbi:DNA-binding protein RFX7-like [Centruroides sculpturatus]|uniref:DNA-binding protein RFX7-like n=1 Tax=Centruroides sculpturatus TaxID=218467 RepID=UPI000C6E69B7|nr:DNA-binding protein RFX7-like [Centruroides sculpturatus]